MAPRLCDRTQFLAWLAGDPAPLTQGGEILGDSDRLKLCWDTETPTPGELPVRIVLPESERREFLGWAATYLGGYRPLTALARVMTHEEEETFLASASRPRLDWLETAWIAGILGEVLESTGDSNGKGLSVRACSSAYLFACARTAALRADPGMVARTGHLWERCRQLSRGGSERTPFAAVREEAARCLSEMRSPGFRVPDLQRRLLDAVRSDNASEALDSALKTVGLQTEGLAGSLQGTREARIAAFDSVALALERFRDIDPVERSLILGFALNAVAPGSLEHLELGMLLAREFPGILIWYGICAGLSHQTAVLSEFDGIGRRIAKELLYNEPREERPRCDLAVEELEVFLGAPRVPRGWRPAQAGSLIVELLPSVYTTLRWHSNLDVHAPAHFRDETAESPKQLGLEFRDDPLSAEVALRKRQTKRTRTKDR